MLKKFEKMVVIQVKIKFRELRPALERFTSGNTRIKFTRE